MTKPLYAKLAGLIDARARCARNNNHEWFDRHTDEIERLVKKHAPSGSGFDAGTSIDLDESTGEKLVFETSFHHMNDNGYYDGWTEHKITVTPSLAHKFSLDISGEDRNGILEFIHEVFHTFLTIEE